jgi:signal transduction histidine kinase
MPTTRTLITFETLESFRSASGLFGGLFRAVMLRLVRRREFPGLVLVVACFVLPLGLFVVDAVRTYDRTLDEATQRIKNTASIFERHARNTFETYELALDLLDEQTRGRTWEELEGSEPLHDYLVRLATGHPQIGQLAMLDAAGFIRVSSFQMPSPPPNFADRNFFIQIRDNHRADYISERVHSRIELGDKINFVRRRTTFDGRFDGVLLVNAKPSTAFDEFWHKGPPGSATGLIREDGRFLARYPDPDLDLTKLSLAGPLMEQAIAGTEAFGSITSPVDQVTRIGMFRPVVGFHLVLAHGMPLDVIMRPWHEALWRNTILYGGAAVSLMILAILVNIHSGRRNAVLYQITCQSELLVEEVRHRKMAEADLENVLLDVVARQEEDRTRIARDLHDSLGQHVALLHLNADSIGQAPENVEAVRQNIAKQKAIAIEISQALSRIAWELRPVWLDDMELEAAVLSFTIVMRERTGLHFSLDCSLGDRRFHSTVEAALYRGVQEAVTNIIKHAHATHVDIVLDMFHGNIRLMIADNGEGFPGPNLSSPGSVATPYGGLGLRGMRERLALVQGSLRIESEPGGGTVLILDVPI